MSKPPDEKDSKSPEKPADHEDFLLPPKEADEGEASAAEYSASGERPELLPLSEEEARGLPEGKDDDGAGERSELLPLSEEEALSAEEVARREKRRQLVRAAKVAGIVAIVMGSILLGYLNYLSSGLPRIQRLEDYHPLVVTTVYDAEGNRIWEFYKEKRIVVPIEEIPVYLRNAFLAAEDAGFYEHGGLDFMGIIRAAIANFRAGGIKQGASTITMQVARTFFLSSERKIVRKIREALLARRIEKYLTKDEILWLYLNQIYLGSGAYGVAAAADIYFHKPLSELTIAEAATIAGVTSRPSAYAPNVNPEAAATRRAYVLGQMKAKDFITDEEYEQAMTEKVVAYDRPLPIEEWPHMPYAMEQLRLELIEKLGEDAIFYDGLSVVTTLKDTDQKAATLALRNGVERLDQRLGFRGALQNLTDETARLDWLQTATSQMAGRLETRQRRRMSLDKPPFETGEVYEALVTGFAERPAAIKGEAATPIVEVALAANQRGVIALADMKWARIPDPEIKPENGEITDPHTTLSLGDVIRVRVLSSHPEEMADEEDKKPAVQKPTDPAPAPGGEETQTAPADTPVLPPPYSYALALYQEPQVQGALLSLDPVTGEIRAMVGGYDYGTSKFNRAVQALRQPGSAFKPVIFSRALIKGYTASSTILDAPVTYQGATDDEVWKPKNYVDRFSGEVTLREALTRSINTIPIKILMDIGVDSTIRYAKDLGITSELTPDPTLALGSSSVTLLDLCRAYSVFANGGFRIEPRLLQEVRNSKGRVLYRRETHWQPPETARFPSAAPQAVEDLVRIPDELVESGASNLLSYGSNGGNASSQVALPSPEDRIKQILQLSPEAIAAGRVLPGAAAYVMTNLLSNVIQHGTGHEAVALHRPAAGKTGTSNENVDNWFIGYTPSQLAGVWLGYDDRQTLGRFNAGGNTAAPIWLEYMQGALAGTPVENFAVPKGVVFSKIDAKTGKLAKPETEQVIFQAFIDGSEPTEYARIEGELRVEDFFQIDQSLKDAPGETTPQPPKQEEDGDAPPSTTDILSLP